MAVRVIPVALTIVFSLLAASTMRGAGPSPAGLPEDSVEFQDGAGSARQAFFPGETAAFYVKDTELGTVATSTATWTGLTEPVTTTAWWSLATGAPQPAVYWLSEGSIYDTTVPANTPLHSIPAAAVGEARYSLTDFREHTGEFTLLNNVDAGSTLVVDFDFDVADIRVAESHRASVTSTSDAGGEWVTVREVLSETDTAASPTSGLFRGEVLLSPDIAAAATGDGAVWALPGDSLTVRYYDSDGATVIDSHQVHVDLPPVPASGWLSLSVLAGILAVVLAWRMKGLRLAKAGTLSM